MSTTVQIDKSASSYDIHTWQGRLRAQKIEITLLCLSIIGFIGLYITGKNSLFSKGGNRVSGVLLLIAEIGFALIILQQTFHCFGRTFLRRIRVETDQLNGQERFHIVTLQ